MIVQLLAGAMRSGPVTAQQQLVHFPTDRTKIQLERRTGDRPVPAFRVLFEQLLRRTHQIAAQTLELMVGRINQGLRFYDLMRPRCK